MCAMSLLLLDVGVLREHQSLLTCGHGQELLVIDRPWPWVNGISTKPFLTRRGHWGWTQRPRSARAATDQGTT